MSQNLKEGTHVEIPEKVAQFLNERHVAALRKMLEIRDVVLQFSQNEELRRIVEPLREFPRLRFKVQVDKERKIVRLVLPYGEDVVYDLSPLSVYRALAESYVSLVNAIAAKLCAKHPAHCFPQQPDVELEAVTDGGSIKLIYGGVELGVEESLGYSGIMHMLYMAYPELLRKTLTP